MVILIYIPKESNPTGPEIYGQSEDALWISPVVFLLKKIHSHTGLRIEIPLSSHFQNEDPQILNSIIKGEAMLQLR
jgi:hypothetical protein